MIPSLVATRTEHSVCLWHPVVADLSGTNTIGELLEPVKVSTPNTTKKYIRSPLQTVMASPL
jgi:hypothetical protein